jgi:predicted AlkP superfamily pyrophosphatase or phosphodiesterase
MLARFGLIICSILFSSMAVCEEQKTTGYFISIDGLMPDKLTTVVNGGHVTAERGLAWIVNNGMMAEKARSVETTLTAASHISTITCTPPSRHGVYANGFLQDHKYVSGFGAPIQTETLWQAAKRQGKSVLSIAYVGADGPGEERKATTGIGYPDSAKTGERQTLEWTWQQLPQANGWSHFNQDAGFSFKEATLEVLINKETGETQTINVLLQEVGRSAQYRMWFDQDKNLSNGFLGELTTGNQQRPFLDLYLVENNIKSDLYGYKRRVTLRWMPAVESSIKVHVSKSSYNAAYPDSFRKSLDGVNLVWPDYGIDDESLSLSESLEAQAYIDNFLTSATLLAQSQASYDIVLFYQPLLDTLGHEHEADLPAPFDPSAGDEVSQAYVKVFQTIDQNISKILQGGTKNDVVTLVSDHGMSPITKAVNLSELLGEDRELVDISTSGSLTMLYVKEGGDPKVADEVGYRLKEQLLALQINGGPALGHAYRKGDRPQGQGFRSEWQYGQAIWAYLASDGVWTRYKPKESELFLEVTAPGMHGQHPMLDSMAATFAIVGPGIPNKTISEISLIDALPTFTAAIGIEPPKDCMGHSLLPKVLQ